MYKTYKVSIIGAGNVGASAAMKLSYCGAIEKIVLLDIKDGIAEGKAMDIMQCRGVQGFGGDVIGVTNDYSATKDSDIIVVTSGVPRKPGMTREDLVGINAGIVSGVVEKCDEYSPNAFYVIVSNPMDTMTLHAINTLKRLHPNIDASKFVIGMGSLLDSFRFGYFVYKALKEKTNFDGYVSDAWVIGGHGDTTMIPIVKDAKIYDKSGNKKSLKDFFSENEINDIVGNTMRGGSILTNLLSTSAWEAPGECISETIRVMISDWRKIGSYIPCSVYREDLGCCIGTLCNFTILPNNRISVLDYKKEPDELSEKVKASSEAIKKVNEALPKE